MFVYYKILLEAGIGIRVSMFQRSRALKHMEASKNKYKLISYDRKTEMEWMEIGHEPA